MQPAARLRAALSGSCADVPGNRALLHLIVRSESGAEVGRFAAGDDGVFAVPPLPLGDYRLYVGGLPVGSGHVPTIALAGARVVAGRLTIDRTDVALTVTVVASPPAITGRLIDPADLGAAGYFVLAFPVDERLWGFPAVRTAFDRSDTDGGYALVGLEPGDYYLTVVSDLSESDLFDRELLGALRSAAVRVSVPNGAAVSLDLRLPIR